jgi:hypothetical protein
MSGVATVWERLAVNKQKMKKFHIEKLKLKKLNKLEVKERYSFEDSQRFAALEDQDSKVDIKSAWETIRENINISAKESRLLRIQVRYAMVS